MRIAIFAFFLVACGSNSDSTPTTAKTTSVVGSACTTDSSCAGAAADGGVSTCFETSFGIALPAGYCSAKCKTVADCGGSADAVACGTPTGDALTDAGVNDTCFVKCDPSGTSTCRAGYVCRALTTDNQPTSDYGCHVPPPG